MKKKLDEAFRVYDNYLNGKKITFKTEKDEYIICEFERKNFLHLTGVKYSDNLSAVSFYRAYKKGQISPKKLSYNSHAKMKLDVFPHLQFEEGQRIELHKNGEYINVSFLNDKVISRNSAILCIDENYPKSLLKKNKPIEGENVRGIVYSIEDITKNNKQKKNVEKKTVNKRRRSSIPPQKQKKKKKENDLSL